MISLGRLALAASISLAALSGACSGAQSESKEPEQPAPSAEAPAPAPSAEPAASAEPATAASAEPAEPTYAGADACTTKDFGVDAIRDACAKGGRPAAKEFMESIVKKARAAGTQLKCTSCHSDMKTFDRKPTAIDDLKKWI